VALSIPRDGIANIGDYTRWQVACWAFIVFMMEKDPWVQAVWRAWQDVRQIPRFAARARREEPVSDATFTALSAAILRVHDPEDLEFFNRVVHDELQIPYIWVPQSLRLAFQQWTAFELELPVPAVTLFTIPLAPDFPIGKGPAHDAKDIIRRVGWLYLTKYWQPPRIKLKPLAKDWATVKGRPGEDLRWEIRQGMKQAEALLDLARW
jgi:hypothetical protein